MVYEFLVPALLAQEATREMHRELLHAERVLSTPSRRLVEELLDGVAAGFSLRRADSGASFMVALGQVVDAVLRHLHRACDRHGVEWPHSEREARTYRSGARHGQRPHLTPSSRLIASGPKPSASRVLQSGNPVVRDTRRNLASKPARRASPGACSCT